MTGALPTPTLTSCSSTLSKYQQLRYLDLHTSPGSTCHRTLQLEQGLSLKLPVPCGIPKGHIWRPQSRVDVDEESGLVYGPFKHAFKCIAKYVAAAWKIRNAYAHPSDVA